MNKQLAAAGCCGEKVDEDYCMLTSDDDFIMLIMTCGVVCAISHVGCWDCENQDN